MVDRAWVEAALSEGPRFSTLIVSGDQHLDATLFEDLRASVSDRPGHIVLVAQPADASPTWSAAADRRGGLRCRMTIGASVGAFDGTARWWSDRICIARSEVPPRPRDATAPGSAFSI